MARQASQVVNDGDGSDLWADDDEARSGEVRFVVPMGAPMGAPMAT